VRILHPHAHAQPTAPQATAASVPNVRDVLVDATGLGSPIQLDKGWRVGITANSAAANTNFDDTTWPIRNAAETFADVPDMDHPANPTGNKTDDWTHGHQRPFVWFRLHVRLAANHGPLSLLIELPISQNASISLGSNSNIGVDVFANGKRIVPQGVNADSPQRFQKISRLYNLALDPGVTELTLVLRTIYIPVGHDAYTNFFSSHNILLGHGEDLSSRLDLWNFHSLFERLPRLISSVLYVILALFLLALYFTQKGHPEYLWLALNEIFQAPRAFVELAGNSAQLDLMYYVAISTQLLLISSYLYFEFLVAFLNLHRRWYIQLLRWSAPVMALVAPAMLTMGHTPVLEIAFVAVMIVSLLWIIGWFIFSLITLIAATLRRNFEAGLLLLPFLLTLVGWIEPTLSGNLSSWAGREYHSPLTIQAGPIPIHFASIADFTGLLVIVIIVFFRFLRVQRDQERAASELAAARSVQELMIPPEKILTPGFEVESVYNPANEVGGDFFYVHPTPDGGLLVVIGDVAGKGLKAAMNVSMLVGALRRSMDLSPARILESLNHVLSGAESLTTCEAAWFGPNGELILANAGHLPPYLNSQEVELAGSLPLGVLQESHYDEIHLFLHPGDRLLLLSDGVVEARKATGELFGFDRVHNLSNQSAFYIADAAKDFGQEDDITVLTVRRLAQAVTA
jgi:uncharacterized membrane protein